MATARFTDRSAVTVPRAWPLAEMPDELLGLAAKTWRLGGDPRAEIERRMGDRAWLRARLGELPEPELATLGTLADAGGAMVHDELCEVLEDRWGIDHSRADRALDALARRALTVPLTEVGWQRQRIDALVAPAADAVAQEVSGLDLAEPPADWREPAPTHEQRCVVAMAAAMAHDRMRITQAGSPHRTHVKRWAKRLGVEPGQIDRWVLAAWRFALCDEDGAGDELRPARAELERLAGGAIVGRGRAARCADAWLTPRPVPAAGLARAIVAELDTAARRRALRAFAGRLSRGTEVLADLTEHPGLALAEHDGTVFAARRAPACGAGDGHVTPSFDVMLGPRADLLALAHVGLAAQLSRVDRVLTYRLTRASVAAAVESGLGADEIVAALGRVGPHGVPDNVEQTVRDWCAGASIARVCNGRFVFVDGDRAEAARVALGVEVLAEPAPGVLQVSPRLTDARLAKLLTGAGVHRVSHGPSAREPDDDGDIPDPSDAPPVPLRAVGDAALRERVSAWRAGAAETPHPDGDAPPAAVLGLAAGGTEDWEPEVSDAGDAARLAEALADTERALRAWAAKLPEGPADALAIARRVGLVVTMLPLNALARAELLARSRSVAELTTGLARVPDRELDEDLCWAIDDVIDDAAVDPRDPDAVDRAVRIACARARTAELSGAFEPLPGASARDALAIAAREGEPVAVHLADGAVAVAVLEGIVDQGSARLVLAHALEDDVPRAWPVSHIAEVRFPADSPALRAARKSTRPAKQRWSPAPGEPIPSASDPCPCGSGRRYKKCCKRR